MTLSSEQARETLRRDHGVRLITDAEEGVPAHALPEGTYGFTGSPLLASPLFQVRRYRNFEVHRLTSGLVVVGFVRPADAVKLTQADTAAVTVRIYPDTEGEANTIVSLPYERVVHHRQYAIRNAEALEVQVHPAAAVMA